MRNNESATIIRWLWFVLSNKFLLHLHLVGANTEASPVSAQNIQFVLTNRRTSSESKSIAPPLLGQSTWRGESLRTSKDAKTARAYLGSH